MLQAAASVLLLLIGAGGVQARKIAFFDSGPAPAPAASLFPDNALWGFQVDSVGSVSAAQNFAGSGYTSVRLVDPDGASRRVYFMPLAAADVNAIGFSWRMKVNTLVDGVNTDETSAVLVELPTRRFAVYFVPVAGGAQLNCLSSGAAGHKVAGVVDDAGHTEFIAIELRKSGAFGSNDKFEVWADFQGSGWSGVECDAEVVSLSGAEVRVGFGAASLAGVGRAEYNIFDFSVSDIPATYAPVSNPMVLIEGEAGSIAWLDEGSAEPVVALAASTTSRNTLDVIGRLQVLGVDVLARLDDFEERLTSIGV